MFGRRENDIEYFSQGREDGNAGVGVFVAEERAADDVGDEGRTTCLYHLCMYLQHQANKMITRKKTSGSSC